MKTKRIRLAAMLSCLCVLVLSVIGIGISAKVSAAAEAQEEIGVSVTLKEDISVHFYVPVSKASAESTLSVSLENVENSTQNLQGVEEDGQYVFTYTGLTPQYMNVKMNASLDGSLIKSLSLRDYCDSLLSYENSPESVGLNRCSFAAMKTLLADMLSYGAHSQAYTAVGGTAANEGFSATGSDWETVGNIPNVTQNNDTSVWTGANLRFSSNVQVLFRFETTVENPTVGITKGGVETRVTPEKVGNAYIACYKEVSATEFDQTLTAQVYNGDETVGGTFVYSVASYVDNMNANERVGALARATYLYGNSAKAFLEAQGKEHSHTVEIQTVKSEYSVGEVVSGVQAIATCDCGEKYDVPYTLTVDGETATTPLSAGSVVKITYNDGSQDVTLTNPFTILNVDKVEYETIPGVPTTEVVKYRYDGTSFYEDGTVTVGNDIFKTQKREDGIYDQKEATFEYVSDKAQTVNLLVDMASAQWNGNGMDEAPLNKVFGLKVNGITQSIVDDAILPALPSPNVDGVAAADVAYQTFFIVNLGEIELKEGTNTISLCLNIAADAAWNKWNELGGNKVDCFLIDKSQKAENILAVNIPKNGAAKIEYEKTTKNGTAGTDTESIQKFRLSGTNYVEEGTAVVGKNIMETTKSEWTGGVEKSVTFYVEAYKAGKFRISVDMGNCNYSQEKGMQEYALGKVFDLSINGETKSISAGAILPAFTGKEAGGLSKFDAPWQVFFTVELGTFDLKKGTNEITFRLNIQADAPYNVWDKIASNKIDYFLVENASVSEGDTVKVEYENTSKGGTAGTNTATVQKYRLAEDGTLIEEGTAVVGNDIMKTTKSEWENGNVEKYVTFTVNAAKAGKARISVDIANCFYKDKRMNDYNLGKVFALEVNGKSVAIPDTAIVPGFTPVSSSTQGAFDAAFQVFFLVDLGEIDLVAGENTITFRLNIQADAPYNEWSQIAGNKIDYFLIEMVSEEK